MAERNTLPGMFTSGELTRIELWRAKAILSGLSVTGDELKYCRKALGYTRGELADMLRVDVHALGFEEASVEVARLEQLAVLALVLLRLSGDL